MRAYRLGYPVNLQVKYDLTSMSDFGDVDEEPIITLVNSGECVAVMTLFTEGINEDSAHVVREIMDFCYMLGRFSDSPESDHAEVWVRVATRTGEFFEVDLDQFSDVEQVAIAQALTDLLERDNA